MIEATIVAIGLVMAAGVFAVTGHLLAPTQTAEHVGDAQETLERRVSRQAARIIILERDLEQLRIEIKELAREQRRRAALAVNLGTDPNQRTPSTEAPNEDLRIARAKFNKGLTQANNRFMIANLGHPRSQYSNDCQAMTNEKLKNALVTKGFGTFRITLLKPAMESFERVMMRLKKAHPDLYDQLGTAGGLCVRLIRGSSRGVSNHSWGTAVDLKIADVLDPFADGRTHAGLVYIATVFNEEKWYWGGAFHREDSMHFEASQEMIRSWIAAGEL